MTPERWQQVKSVLEEILECDVTERDDRLRRACAGDDELRTEVESLLAHAGRDDMLESSAVRQPPVPESALTSHPEIPAGPAAQVRPLDLPPYTRIDVHTRQTRYEIIVIAPLESVLLMKGGRRFPRPTLAHLYRQDSIRVGDTLQLMVGRRKVVTTPIEAIYVIR